MNHVKIMIVIEGGLIQNILSTGGNVDILTVDYDAFKDRLTDDDDDPTDEAVSVRFCEPFRGNWSDTISGENLSECEQLVKARLSELDKEFPYDPPGDAPEQLARIKAALEKQIEAVDDLCNGLSYRAGSLFSYTKDRLKQAIEMVERTEQQLQEEKAGDPQI